MFYQCTRFEEGGSGIPASTSPPTTWAGKARLLRQTLIQFPILREFPFLGRRLFFLGSLELLWGDGTSNAPGVALAGLPAAAGGGGH